MDTFDCAVIGAGVVGLAVARALALQGREVIVLEAEGATVSRLGRRLDKLGPNGFAADVTDRAQVDAAFAAARQKHGPISILVNNAGAAHGALSACRTPGSSRSASPPRR